MMPYLSLFACKEINKQKNIGNHTSATAIKDLPYKLSLKTLTKLHEHNNQNKLKTKTNAEVQ